VAQTKRDKEREIARLREQLKNDGELVRHSIFDCSQVVESRKQFGHWEIDLVLPAKMNNQRYQDTTAIMTLTERKTRFTALIIVHFFLVCRVLGFMIMICLVFISRRKDV